MSNVSYEEQVSLARVLDRCADRAECVDATPASRKQIWFLAKLILEAGDERTKDEMILNTSYILTSREASSLISLYLGDR